MSNKIDDVTRFENLSIYKNNIIVTGVIRKKKHQLFLITVTYADKVREILFQKRDFLTK